jgi:hypothetical protein
MAQTVRGVAGRGGTGLRPEGTSLRYAAIAALGLDRVPVEVQRRVLDGDTASELAWRVAARAATTDDVGAVALAAWTMTEVTGDLDVELLARCRDALETGVPLPTVSLSWMVCAAVAAHGLTDTSDLVMRAARRLRGHEGPRGLFPHVMPALVQPWWRRHVGSFADNIYPVQALARAAVLTGDSGFLAAAERTADRLCALQGAHGQWWWHYDVRDGTVVEPYPVYSVHQHAMGPMALFDLADAGGPDRRAAVASGVRWLDEHPEVVEDLVHERHRVVWRKVGRHELRKAARGLSALASAVHRGWRAPGVDRWWRPTVVDHECRPYEPAWTLFAWLPPRAADPGRVTA